MQSRDGLAKYQNAVGVRGSVWMGAEPKLELRKLDTCPKREITRALLPLPNRVAACRNRTQQTYKCPSTTLHVPRLSPIFSPNYLGEHDV